MRHVKLIVLGALALLVLALPATAAARSRDRNHDRIPDRWERAHHLSLKVKQAKRDQDRDGLRNRAEFRAHMDPRDADSDDDGVDDGSEQAGKVVSFDGTNLTIDVFGSSPLTGTVTADTEIECDPGDDNGNGSVDSAAWRHDEQGDSENDGNSNDQGDDQGEDSGDDSGDQGDDNEQDDESCPDGALAPGAIVQEAELSLTSGGLVFDKIELVG
jgi:hypothetical protein